MPLKQFPVWLTKKFPVAKDRTAILVLSLGATIAVVAGGLAASWVLTQRRPLVASLPVGSDIVPQDALMTLSLSTDSSQWRTLRQFGTSETQEILDKNLNQWRDRFLTDYGLDYQRDIQPWIGEEMTVALLAKPPEVPAPNSNPGLQRTRAEESVPLLLVLPIADAGQAQRVLTAADSNQEWTERDYQGVQIRETRTDDGSLSAAVLDNQVVVLTSDPDAIEQTIDTHQGGKSVADTPGYSQAVGRIAATDPFVRLYVNAPVAKAIATANTLQPLQTQDLSPLKHNQGIAANITLGADGIEIQAIGWLSPDGQQRYEVKNSISQLPNLLPEETLMMASGSNLQQLWLDYSRDSVADPKSLGNPANFREAIRTTTGLDLDQDLLSWMDGEFSVALIPVTTPDSTRQSAGLLLMAKASDRQTAEEALKRLDDAMSDRYRFTVREDEVKGQPVVNWVSPFSALTVTRGWLNGDIAFLALGAPVANAILPNPDYSLSQNEAFKKTLSPNLASGNGRFFADLDRLVNRNTNIPIPNLPEDQDAVVKAIRAIGVTTAIHDERSTRYDIQVLLQKVGNPRPAPNP